MPATRQKKNLERLVLEIGHEEGKRKKKGREGEKYFWNKNIAIEREEG